MSGTDDPRAAAARLELYTRTARALNQFFAAWTAAFCHRCLEVTARSHPNEPGADVVLLDGQFPGCCQPGVAETLTLPNRGGEGRLPEDLARRLKAARAASGAGVSAEAQDYTLRESRTGRQVRGRGCRHLGADGCALGELKAPLCLFYLCEGVRTALHDALGTAPAGEAEDGSLFDATDTLRAVATGSLRSAQTRVKALEEELHRLSHRLRMSGVASGVELLDRWLQSATVGALPGSHWFRGSPGGKVNNCASSVGETPTGELHTQPKNLRESSQPGVSGCSGLLAHAAKQVPLTRAAYPGVEDPKRHLF